MGGGEKGRRSEGERQCWYLERKALFHMIKIFLLHIQSSFNEIWKASSPRKEQNSLLNGLPRIATIIFGYFSPSLE